MKLLCKMLGGSHAYGLNGPNSDVDHRGVFLNTELSKLVGLDRFEHVDVKEGGKDEFYFEFRHFLGLLRKTNTQVLEVLYNTHWLEKDPVFDMVLNNKERLLDSEKMFKSLLGYMCGERKLMLGERTGTLGGKRREALEKYGYSYKNAVQMLRLAYCGETFFLKGYFPVNVMEDNPEYGEFLLHIKNNPEKYNKESADKLTLDAEERVKKAFDSRNFTYHFDEDFAHELCLRFYFPLMEEAYKKL